MNNFALPGARAWCAAVLVGCEHRWRYEPPSEQMLEHCGMSAQLFAATSLRCNSCTEVRTSQREF